MPEQAQCPSEDGRPGRLNSVCLALEITRRCTMDCGYCYVRPRRSDLPELPLETYRSLLRHLQVCYADRHLFVHMAGGEVFLRSGITELIGWLLDRRMPVRVVTNGLSIPEEIYRDDRFRRGRRLLGIEVSIDGLKPAHETMRKAFETVRRSFERLVASGVGTKVRTTVHRGNLYSMQDFHQYLNRVGEREGVVLSVDVQPVLTFPRHPCGGTFEEIQLTLQEYLEEGMRISRYAASDLPFVKTSWVFVERGRSDSPSCKVPVEGAFYGCSTGLGLEVSATGAISLCEMAPPFHRLSENPDRTEISKLVALAEREAVPNTRCMRCDRKAICGMCRLSPLVHGYPRSFGYKDCYPFMRDVYDIQQAWV